MKFVLWWLSITASVVIVLSRNEQAI